MITIFYDGQCGLCSREIRYYQRIAPEGVFNWVDVTKDWSVTAALGLTPMQALMNLHGKDAAGRLHVGVDAFILMWRALPRWRLLGMFVSLAPIHALARFVYRRFAAWRFARLDHCRVHAPPAREAL